MSYAAIDAERVAKAAENSLKTLQMAPDDSEVYRRKTAMIERIQALAAAASETQGQGLITLTSEEFWLISKNW